jgi:hypothetical protein
MRRRMDSDRPGQAMAQPPVDLERRHVTALTALALLGSATIALTSCSGGASTPVGPSATTPPPTGSTCPPDGACGQITGSPSHSAVITAAQLATGAALVLEIRGASDHPHTVSLSAEDVVAIREKRRVEKVSSVDSNHDHGVTFN